MLILRSQISNTHAHIKNKTKYQRKHKMFKLIVGPMFSGKSSALISECSKYRRTFNCNGKPRKVLCIKPAVDTRFVRRKLGSNVQKCKITTHDKNSIDAILYESIDSSNIKDVIKDNDVFVIDEIQFIVDGGKFVKQLLKNKKIVIAAGLSGDFMQKTFSTISDLYPLATKIIHKTSICSECNGNDACYTVRKNKNKNQVAIGGSEMYSVVCCKCFF